MATDPLQSAVYSLLWIDGRYWTPYLVLFTLFLAPAERWLGEIRWLTVGLTAHVGATYFSEGLLYLEIQHHLAPERLVHARDIGVSYFMVGVIAVLAYHIAPPWRWGYLAVLIIVFAVPLIIRSELHCDRPLLGDLHRPVVLSDGPTIGASHRSTRQSCSAGHRLSPGSGHVAEPGEHRRLFVVVCLDRKALSGK